MWLGNGNLRKLKAVTVPDTGLDTLVGVMDVIGYGKSSEIESYDGAWHGSWHFGGGYYMDVIG